MVSKVLLCVLPVGVGSGLTFAQTQPAPTPAPKTPPQTSRPTAAPTTPQTGAGRDIPFKLADYGVAFKPDARLIVVMAALDAAGFDPIPAGREASVFRARVRKDQADLAPALREKLHSFY